MLIKDLLIKELVSFLKIVKDFKDEYVGLWQGNIDFC